MALRYDFDIAVVPGAMPLALWRDQAVVDALTRADPIVQKYFRDSGFGMATFDSGAPPDRFPAADEPVRADIIGKLTDNVQAVDIEGLNWGGFDLRAFLTYLGGATPIDMPAAPEPKVMPEPPKPEPPKVDVAEPDLDLGFDREELLRAMQPSKRKGIAMVVLALGVILIGIAALMALP